jgi:enoyl-CoA hydratase/carnithine racemase
MLSHEISKIEKTNLFISTYQACENVASVTLNRASVRNTLSIDTLKELIETFSELNSSSRIFVIVLCGLGEAFAAGADIKELLKLTPETAVSFSLLGSNLFRLISNSPKLVIAAIDGFCMGGGLDLALSCDLRYASKNAIFAHPGANIGIITGFGGTYRLPKLIGRRNAERLFSTAEKFSAKQALEIGLIQSLSNNSSAHELALGKAFEFSTLGPSFVSDIKKLTQIVSKPFIKESNVLLANYHKLASLK